MLDTTFVNSATLFTKANNMQLGKKQNRPYLLGMEMAKSLFMPYIKARSRKGLQEGILRKIRFVLKEKDVICKSPGMTSNSPSYRLIKPSCSDKQRRCGECLYEICGEGKKKCQNTKINVNFVKKLCVLNTELLFAQMYSTKLNKCFVKSFGWNFLLCFLHFVGLPSPAVHGCIVSPWDAWVSPWDAVLSSSSVLPELSSSVFGLPEVSP